MVHQHEGIYTKLTGPDIDAPGGGCTFTEHLNRDIPADSHVDEQAKIADMVDAHLEKEKLQGQEIKPSAIQQCRSAAYMQAEGSKTNLFPWLRNLSLTWPNSL